MADTPKINRTLATLLPNTLPTASSALPLKLATRFTKSSGREVPKETTVSPMTRSDKLNFLPIEDAPSTNRSAPLMSKTKPRTNRKYCIQSWCSGRTTRQGSFQYYKKYLLNNFSYIHPCEQKSRSTGDIFVYQINFYIPLFLMQSTVFFTSPISAAASPAAARANFAAARRPQRVHIINAELRTRPLSTPYFLILLSALIRDYLYTS